MKGIGENRRGRSRLPRRFFCFLSAVLLLALPSIHALAADSEEDIAGAGYTAVLYDNTSGLPTSEANDLVQTSSGFILIGGYSGLVRFDGNSFHRYDASTGISSVRCLYVDSGDRVWIGTNENGAAVVEQEEVVCFYTRSDGLNSSSIQDITEDERGNILLATTMGLAYVGTDGKLQLIDDPRVNREYIRSLKTGPDGVVYGLTRGGDLFTVENLRVSAFYPAEELDAGGTINAVLPDPEHPGFVYLGTLGSDVCYGELDRGLSVSRVFTADPQKR